MTASGAAKPREETPMCGIIGYCGHRPAVSLIVEGLKRLEYRGYDSAGVAFPRKGTFELIRSEGKLANLEDKLGSLYVYEATSGMGHTRWATHGAPVERNAHPHADNSGRVVLVHNGIIENYQQLKNEMLEQGVRFNSETDTEVLVNLAAEGLRRTGDMLQGLSWALGRVEGAYAIVLQHADEPEALYAARKSSPLVMGQGVGENFVASDIPAFLPYTRKVVFLEDGELCRLTASQWSVHQADDLAAVDKDVQTIDWDVQAAQKGGYKHFMLKEIFEQPQVIQDCLAGRLDGETFRAALPEIEDLEIPDRLVIVACGTSYHAGLWGVYLLESWAKVPVSVEIASEFRYRDLIMDERDMVLAISQSGETADTLAGLRIAKEHGAKVIGLCNVVGSSVARESDAVIYTQAGPEISVASTKAMCSQLTALLLLALCWGEKRGTLDPAERRRTVDGLSGLPKLLEAELPGLREKARELARKYSEARSFLYLGRGLNYPLALEGALKLKEISYIHAEGYAAGEMKHGPIALIDPNFPTFALAPDDKLFPKVKSNLEEVQARAGRIAALTGASAELSVDDPWRVPDLANPLCSFIFLPALQLFAYEMAVYLGKDVDQPRNLAKSVTVE
jgi:glucosamine--fructose-6-phosphate aminotransferase (isomerizing)